MKKAIRRGEYRHVEAVERTSFRLLQRNPLANQGTVDELLANLRENRDPQERTVVLEAILSGEMGPVVRLDNDIVVANLSSDRWTRAIEPAGLVIRNQGLEERVVDLKLTCLAPREFFPVAVFLEGRDGIKTLTFTEAGGQTIELWPVPAGQKRLVTVWSDTAWQPSSKDRRWLGVNLAIAD